MFYTLQTIWNQLILQLIQFIRKALFDLKVKLSLQALENSSYIFQVVRFCSYILRISINLLLGFLFQEMIIFSKLPM